MRITGGTYRGRRLTAPKGGSTRPTADRIRAALFNILCRGVYAFDFEQAHVLDVFCGTGALGLEALSHGASSSTFIEQSAAAVRVVENNIKSLGVETCCSIIKKDAARLTAKGNDIPPASLVFLDPPYKTTLGCSALACLSKGGWLAPEALIVFETAKKNPDTYPASFQHMETRDYGDTRLLFLQFKGEY